jgi:hypothetical protein
VQPRTGPGISDKPGRAHGEHRGRVEHHQPATTRARATSSSPRRLPGRPGSDQ